MQKIELTITDVRNKITAELIERYGSVKTFAENPKLLRKAGIQTMAPASIQSCLAGSGSTSFKLYQTLWEYLQLGKLEKEIIKTVKYYEHASEDDIHQE